MFKEGLIFCKSSHEALLRLSRSKLFEEIVTSSRLLRRFPILRFLDIPDKFCRVPVPRPALILTDFCPPPHEADSCISQQKFSRHNCHQLLPAPQCSFPYWQAPKLIDRYRFQHDSNDTNFLFPPRYSRKYAWKNVECFLRFTLQLFELNIKCSALNASPKMSTKITRKSFLKSFSVSPRLVWIVSEYGSEQLTVVSASITDIVKNGKRLASSS